MFPVISLLLGDSCDSIRNWVVVEQYMMHVGFSCSKSKEIHGINSTAQLEGGDPFPLPDGLSSYALVQ